MPLNKPSRGDLNWDVSLNTALEYLDGKLGTTGATGATGPTGPAGPAGPRGIQGIPGPAADFNISGGSASSVYTINQSIDGGTAGSF
jgi:hypothetical protein